MKKILILLLIAVTISAQTKDANKILKQVKDKFEKVKDYEVDANIHLDINFIKMPDTKAKIFFKQPNKMKMQADGFAMLPKQGMNFSPAQLLTGKFSALYVRSEMLDNHKVDVIKVIPNSDTSEVILSSLWVDATQNLIRKVESTTKNTGTLNVNLEYADENFALPSLVKFSFNLGDLQIPSDVPTPAPKKENNKFRRDAGPVKGTVVITYSNYKIDKGIPDSFFAEKEKKK
jgi:outer membrane lipoprotein-sorting protein